MAQPERAILAGVIRSGGDGADARLEELARLAESAGAVVAGTLVQRRAAPHSATFLGAGKIEELQQLCYETSADLVILDHELSPAQQRNLERKLNLKVIDRPGIVLDIFARRARTREGRLQVELAQMTYLLPRLTGRGVLLSRLGGGIGTRGPGETKLEVDRRRIRKRAIALPEVPEAKAYLRPPAETCLTIVGQVYGTDREALLWTRRGQRNEARAMAMYVCRQLGGMKLQEIARLFGVGGYSTVRSVIGRARTALDKGGPIRQRFDQIRQRLER